MDLQAYLSKKYGAAKSSLDLKPKKKKMKVKKQKLKSSLAGVEGVRIVDDDAAWQKEVKAESDEVEEEAPAVVEDEELTRSKRIELLKRRTYLSIGEQGGGWVDVTTAPRNSTPDPSPTLPTPTSAVGDEPDMSPPRRRARHDSPDMSPVRRARKVSPDISKGDRARHDSPDMSPPRKGDTSRRARHDSPDMSPPRKGETSRRARHDSPDMSPPRKGRRNVSPDMSPPRRRARHGSPATSPSRLKVSPDLSPPRKIKQEEDLSPPRRGRHGSADISRVKVKQEEEQDLSPPRRRDLSPPRRRHTSPPTRTGRRNSPPLRNVKQEPEEDLSPPRRGRTSGLKTGGELREEILQKQTQDAKRFQQLDSSVTGRGAETVYRDKHGRKLAGVEELVKQRQKGRSKPVEKPLEWGTGLAQKRDALKRQEEFEAERDKPFARSKDDLDAVLKNRIRWGDPMAHLVKQSDEMLLEDFSKNEKMAESGFNVPQDIPTHSWLKRRLAAAPNRYNIRPGRHWDGIDRSNGFEEKLFTAQNQQKAQLDMAYKWSVQDM